MIAPTSFFADYGCHVRILEETRILEQMGHRVAICTYHNGRDLPRLDVRRTMAIPWRQEYEVGSSRHKIAFDILLFLRTLRAGIQFRPHVIHAHLHEGALIGNVLSRMWGVPLVFDFQGSLTSEMIDHHFLSPDGFFYGPTRRMEEIINHLSPHILTSSAHAANLLTEAFRCSEKKITCVPDAVNLEMFKPLPRDEEWRRLKRAWNVPTDRTVIVYLGLLAEYQGTGHLLRAARLLCEHRKDVHFLIAGYPNVEHYRGLAQRLGLDDHVTFTNKVRYEDAPRVLSLGDIAVSPKLSKTEGAGKLLNYMAMALPTVTFDTAVSHEYLGKHGVYAARGDTAALAEAIESLVQDPTRRKALGTSLRRDVERFSWQKVGQTIVDVYAAAIGNPFESSSA